jgi:hypothetical protein
MNYNVANKFRGIHNGGGRGYVMYEPKYHTLLQVGQWGEDCHEEMPVCPPMFHFKQNIIHNTLPKKGKPQPSLGKPSRVKTLPVIQIRKPRRIAPGGDPAPETPSNWPSGGGGGGSQGDAPFCRQCGPKVDGVIGVPDPDSINPFPLRLNGLEVSPFELIFGEGTVPVGIRQDGDYYSITPTNYEEDQVIQLTIGVDFPALEDGGISFSKADLTQEQWEKVPGEGTVYVNGESINYSAKGSWDVVGDNVSLSFLFNVGRDSTRGTGLPFRPADSGLRVDLRSPHMVGDSAYIFLTPTSPAQPTYLDITVNDDLSISNDQDSQNIKFSGEGLDRRGSGYVNGSYLVVQNSVLAPPGGAAGDYGGCVVMRIQTMRWPDADIDTCVAGSTSFPTNTSRYCCHTGFLTPSDWPYGEGRCAPMADYQNSFMGEYAQHCPFGFEYDPEGMMKDGLTCKQCESGTTSFDSGQAPSNPNCDPGQPGLGCQKCCEDAGRDC